ncbi:VTT domain-containing protein [Reyranella aquatilis]|uniref:TVP38/TMEM64 family membrane protein n=1 Tax=Reyranella aquatilis TaxID=2035356 RepID=A0ABS8KUX7_9HYPH|nr:VTT domain-containing protein [Reyranella aquatilis]MCC8429391.1 VTT domain-containing protein [Reyranella aquatilis]
MRLRFLLAVAALLFAVVGIAAAWWTVGSLGIVTPEKIGAWLAATRGHPWAPAVVVAAFIVAGLVVFPIHGVVLATATVFGGWTGFAYSAVGVFFSGWAPYFIGALLGKDAVARNFGPRVQPVLRAAKEHGVLVVVGLRIVPAAPGTLTNLALGASGIRFPDFIIGTLVGMLPGLIVVSLMGDRLMAFLQSPSLLDIVLLALCVAAYVAIAVGAQILVSRWRK